MVSKFNPLVSIIIPVYNGSNYIREAIDSALAQTYKNIEIIIVNDGSKDNTEEIVKSYKDKRIKYFKKENGGVATALNLGIEKMKGDYFSWLSHDDIYYPDKIEKQIKVLAEKKQKDQKNSILMSNYSLIDEKSEITYSSHFEKNHLFSNLEYPLYALLNGMVNGLTLLIPKKCFKETGYFDPNLRATQDYALWFKMFPKYKIIFMTDLLAKTRMHGGQVTNKPSTFLENDILWINMVKSMTDEQKIAVGGSVLSFYQKIYKVVKDAHFIGAEKYLLKFIKCNKKRNISKIKVSVIIPFFNRIGWTIDAIKSVLYQSHKNFELILVNDFSTENIKAIRNLVKKDHRIKLVNNKRNKGVSGARNTGIDMATGEYIVFLDSDDLFIPTKIKKQLKFMVRKGLFFSHTSYELFSDSEKDNKIIESGDIDFIYPNIISDCIIATPTVMLHSDLFKDKSNRFLENYFVGEDTCLWIKISKNFQCTGLNNVLTKVRKHNSNAAYDRKKRINGINNILNYVIKNCFDLYNIRYIYELNESLITIGGKDKNNEIKKHFKFNNLQISDNDIIGNKFNGHDLHFYLRENNINSCQLVWNKESKDINTFQIASEEENRMKIYLSTQEIQKKYKLNSLLNPLAYDLLYNKLFLDTDIVHFHLIHNYIFDIQLLPIMSRLKPLVWTLHDPWALGGHCIHHYDCEKWKTQCGDCPYLDAHFPLDQDNSTLNFEIKKRAIKDSKIDVIVASKWMLNKVKESPIFKNKRIHLIPFGINQEIFKPFDKNIIRGELNIPNDALVIVFRCSYSGFKGMDYIEYVLKNLKTKKKIYILSLGNDFKVNIKNIICINFGWIKDDNLLVKIYNASDLFLAPSKADSFGMMAVEAMSCGVLPIVLDGTALSDTVNTPDCGISVRPSKLEYLKAVQYFVIHDKERGERAKKCYDYAKNFYNKDQYVKKIVKVYEEAIKKHSLNKEDKNLLEQLKKYMSLDSKRYDFENELVLFKGNYITSFLNRHIPFWIKRKVKNYILIFFYKIDKIFPKKLRKFLKKKLIRFRFIRKYLIK